jgi:two-component sensor histidine kinase
MAQEDIKIDYRIYGTNICLNTDQMMPLALIVNELIFNSLKYAFQGKNKGHISVNLNEADNKITIAIGHNGVGLSDNIDIYKPDSLGLKFIKKLTEQLNGKLDVILDNGTQFIIELPKENV